MQVTQHFNKSEFTCPCCGEGKVNLALVIILEEVRAAFDAPVTINSAYRCEKHNQEVGGAENSQHLQGTAADIVVQGIPAREVYHWLRVRPYANALGLGMYKTFTHVDVRGVKARWGNTTA